MNYRLVILTHGTHRKDDSLERTLYSFMENVQPAPALTYLHQDGAGAPRFGGGFPTPITIAGEPTPVGFCEATRRCWAAAAAGEQEHVFWLEHDFEFTRPVDLSELACVVEHDRAIAQVALMRDAANDAERDAGGLFELRRDEYRYPEMPATAPTRSDVAVRIFRYLEHRSYFTTTPSLMRREFMAENPWPDYAEQCEGRFGIDLAERGYRYAVWGDGEPWVRHIGERSGFGY